jgi:hypothetical protein
MSGVRKTILRAAAARQTGAAQPTWRGLYFIFFTFVTVLLPPQVAFAWGGLGHRIVADNAAWLLEDARHDAWSRLLLRHRVELSIYAFEPDNRFRHEDGAHGAAEAPAHVWVPASTGKPHGIAPARINQLLSLAKTRLNTGIGMKGGYGSGAAAVGPAHDVFVGLYYLGVMAHYSGDAGVPFHGVVDQYGNSTGQGGIHFFFESDCVEAREPGLSSDALQYARKERAAWDEQAKGWSIEELGRRVFEESAAATPEVLRLDREQVVTKLGDAKTSAQRRDALQSCSVFHTLLVQRLARAAWLTATLWQRALPEGVGPQETLRFSDLVVLPYLPPP